MNIIIQGLGFLGTLCFSISGIPQAIKSCREGNSDGIAHGTVVSWLMGEVIMLNYSYIMYPNDYILIANYLINLLTVGIIAKYKYLPVRKI